MFRMLKKLLARVAFLHTKRDNALICASRIDLQTEIFIAKIKHLQRASTTVTAVPDVRLEV